MKRDLILIINDYPFNKGEPFFENEVIALSKGFDRIFIFSVNGKINESPTRNTPFNVSSFPLNCNHNRIKYLLLGYFSKDELFSFKGKSGSKRLMSAYILGRNNVIYKKIITRLKKINFSESTVYIYSYWLTLGIASIKIKNYLEKILKKEIKTFSRCHGYDVYSEVNKYNYQPFQYEVIEQMDKVYPCSKYGMNYLINKYPKFKDKIEVSYLSTNDYGIEKYCFKNETKHLITIAGFRPVKRMDFFARAFVKAVNKGADYFWDSFGSGEDFEKVQRFINETGNSNKVKFHGNVPNCEIYNYLKQNEIYFFVNVSSSEGLPVSIMEATSFGIPIIATNVGGTSELVDESNGILLSQDINEDELAEKLVSLYNLDHFKYDRLRKISRKKWDTSFNSSKNLDLWVQKILNNKR